MIIIPPLLLVSLVLLVHLLCAAEPVAVDGSSSWDEQCHGAVDQTNTALVSAVRAQDESLVACLLDHDRARAVLLNV